MAVSTAVIRPFSPRPSQCANEKACSSLTLIRCHSITPAVGYVGVPAAFGVGFLTAIACNFATALKHFVKVDDAVDAFALHACGGFLCV